MRTTFSATAALLLASCASAVAAQRAPSRTTEGPLPASITSNLPRNARPLHYRIDVHPDAQTLTFTGTESVTLRVYEPADALTLNANELTIASAKLTPLGREGAVVDLRATIDPAAQQVRFAAARTIAPGTYRLDVVYSGKINTQANGLFALDYPDKRTGKTVRSLFTQFEAPDGRRFAPEFDEPAYKATFELSAVVPADQMAISNTPIAKSVSAGAGLKHVYFGETPKMSSYLLFLATGYFDRIAKQAPDGVEAGIVTPAGSGEEGRFALDSMAQILPYYEDYFGQKYPLPKLDNVAGPGQSQFFSAMENWGAIFTFNRELLVDPAITSPLQKQRIYEDQAHEMAHQWFGDLVTMAWWDDIWLNEGFASWMETKATDHFHPEWYPLLGRVDGRERAMELDSFKTTHPVVQPVRTVEEIDQAFDAIAYQKGEAVLAMLEAYAGADTWRDGIRAYIAAHKYGSATTDDLWQAVESAGVPRLDRDRPRLHPAAGHSAGSRGCVVRRRPGQPVADARGVQPRPHESRGRRPATLAGTAVDRGGRGAPGAHRPRRLGLAHAAGMRTGDRQRWPARLLPHPLFAGDAAAACHGHAAPAADRPDRAGPRQHRAGDGRV